jgi:hypothetical protein
MNKLIQKWPKGIKWFVIFFVPIMTVGFILIPILDKTFPWTVAEEEILRDGKEGFLLCVGLSFGSKGIAKIHKEERSYILIPSVFTNPRIISVTEFNGNEIQIEESIGGFFAYIIFFTGILATTFTYSIPEIRKLVKAKMNRITRSA